MFTYIRADSQVDDGEESSTWENEWLQDDQVPCSAGIALSESFLTVSQVATTLTSKAVLLRLAAGTQEADFLSAFCPIGQVPTLVIIQ